VRVTINTILVTVALLVGALDSHAIPTGSLEFSNRVAQVTPLEAIDVRLRLTLSPNSERLTTDAAGRITSGLSEAEIALTGITTLELAQVSTIFVCSGTFNSSCLSGPPYDFVFDTGPDSIVGRPNLDLAPGDSLEFLFGRFVPTLGQSVPPATYRFASAGVFLSLVGIDEQGARIDNFFTGPKFSVAETCVDQAGDCAFTRTVVGQVGEPGVAWLLGITLAIAFGHCRRMR